MAPDESPVTTRSETDSSRCGEPERSSSKISLHEGRVDEAPLPFAGAPNSTSTSANFAPDAKARPPTPQAAAAKKDVPRNLVPESGLSDAAELAWRQASFRAVVQNDITKLQEVLSEVPQEVWQAWENKAGKDLITLAQERGSSSAYAVLARAMGLLQERKHSKLEAGDSLWVMVPGEVQPRRATAVKGASEDDEDVLVEFWDGDAPASRVPHVLVSKLT